MYKKWIASALLILTMSCTTFDLQRETILHSAIDPDSPIYMVLDMKSQRYLVEDLLVRYMDNPSELGGMLDRTELVILGNDSHGWTVEAWGNYPLGSLKMALRRSNFQSSQSHEGFSSITSAGRIYIYTLSRNRIILSNKEEHWPSDFTVELIDENDLKSLVYISINDYYLDEFWKQAGPVHNLCSALEVDLIDIPNSDYHELELAFQGEDGKERPLQAATRIYLLGLLDSRVMESKNYFMDGWLIYEEIFLSHDEWQDLIRDNWQGESF